MNNKEFLVKNIKLLQSFLDKEITKEEFNRKFYPYTLDEVLEALK